MPASASAPTLGAQLFINFSHIDSDPPRAQVDGWHPDLKRFYLDLEHDFSDEWQFKLTTDIQWRRRQDPGDLWFRHAYLERALGKDHSVKLGIAQMPWIDYIARRVGYRYVDPSLTPKNGLASPTEPGIHYGGGHGAFSWAISLASGSGFKRPRVSDSVDVEAAGVWHISRRVDLAIGSYHGTRMLARGDRPKFHTARRRNVALSYLRQGLRFHVEYAWNDNWNQVSQVEGDASRGWSAWTSYAFSPRYSAFVRYDATDPSRRLAPSLEQSYLQLGVDHRFSDYLTVALVGKRSRTSGRGAARAADEIGVWTMWNF